VHSRPSALFSSVLLQAKTISSSNRPHQEHAVHFERPVIPHREDVELPLGSNIFRWSDPRSLNLVLLRFRDADMEEEYQQWNLRGADALVYSSLALLLALRLPSVLLGIGSTPPVAGPADGLDSFVLQLRALVGVLFCPSAAAVLFATRRSVFGRYYLRHFFPRCNGNSEKKAEKRPRPVAAFSLLWSTVISLWLALDAIQLYAQLLLVAMQLGRGGKGPPR
ncbi:unnamed protein product, partial [Discosporangium mesarthrocarpum]